MNKNGTKTFVASYRYGTRQRRLTLGPYPIISLAEARDKARAAFREGLDGVDPKVRRRQHMTLREGVELSSTNMLSPETGHGRKPSVPSIASWFPASVNATMVSPAGFEPATY